MGTIADKLAYLSETKNQLSQALAAKGAALEDGTPFREYPNLISRLEGGGYNFAFGAEPPSDPGKLWIRSSRKTDIIMAPQALGLPIKKNYGKLPDGCCGMAAVPIGKKIYLLGGHNGSEYLSTINVFDTETAITRTLLAALPGVATRVGAAAVGTRIYIFGGYNGSFLNTISVLDTEAETVTTLEAVLPTATYGMGCAAVGKKIYLFGGQLNKSSLNTILEFNTETEEITTLSATLTSGREDMGCSAVGTKIYLFGGTLTRTSFSWTVSDTYSEITVFDTELGTLTKLTTTLPTADYQMAAAAVGSCIYLLGGSNGDDQIRKFNTENSTIITLDTRLPEEMQIMGVAAIGTTVYLFGGSTQTASSGSDKIILFHTDNETISSYVSSALNPVNATLPVVGTEPGMAVLGTKVYLFGGSGGVDTATAIHEFDMEERTIRTLEVRLPKPACAMAAAAVGTKIYLFGGRQDYHRYIYDTKISTSGTALDCILVFDPEAGTVEALDTVLPTATYGSSAVAVDTKIYVFGGNSLATINLFDTETGTITTLGTVLPAKARDMGCAVVEGKIYLFGGYGSSALKTINVYDIAENTITTLGVTLESAEYGLCAAAVGSKIFLFSGTSNEMHGYVLDTVEMTLTDLGELFSDYFHHKRAATMGETIFLFGGICDTFDDGNSGAIRTYDVGTGELHTLDVSVPGAASRMASAIVGRKIYLFGGYARDAFYNTIRVYDIASDTMTTLGVTLAKAASNMGAAVVGRKIYLFGGFGSHGPMDMIQVFDTETESIVTLDAVLPVAMCRMGTAAVGKNIYLFGGRTDENGWVNAVGDSRASRGTGIDTILKFGTEELSVTTLVSRLTKKAYNITAAAVGAMIYLFGGNRYSSGYYYPTADIEAFDTEAGRITALETLLPASNHGISAVTVGTKIYLLGGYGSLDTVNVFDTVSKSITAINNTIPQSGGYMSGEAYDRKIYFFGGEYLESSARDIFRDRIHVLDTMRTITGEQLRIVTDDAGNIFPLMYYGDASIQAGISSAWISNDGCGELVDIFHCVNGEWKSISE